MQSDSKTRLGRGLSALISDETAQTLNKNTAGVIEIDISKIKANPYQPRQSFEMNKLLELAESIRQNGVLQPIIVTKDIEDNYTLIIGERRLRASKLAGLTQIPAVIKDMSRQDMLEIAVIENIQREDLSPIEEARAYKQLLLEFKLSLTELAKKISKSKSFISNKTRLLKLPQEIINALQNGVISEGHAKAILGLLGPDLQIQAFKITVKNNLSVRDTEDLVNRLRKGDINKDSSKKIIEYVLSGGAKKIQRDLGKYLDVPVRIVPLKDGGKLVMRYKTETELEQIFKKVVNQ
ncbi:ParB/RepB/Spo0J family partition protein [Candidatus Dojkabacteria bacterium]|nr:ParB/RepB/Spo0J family partition protein [Candidatus Dojkabacteria bacterium]